MSMLSALQSAEERALTADQIDAIHEALRDLAGMDPDGASEVNDEGYNQADSDFGHQLAELDKLTPAQALAARRMLRKYWRQLGNDVLVAMGCEPV